MRIGIKLLGLLGGVALLAAARRRREISLDGRTVIITGASRGLGYILAQQMARSGANLVICARHKEPLEEACARLESEGAQVLALAMDVANRQACSLLVQQAEERFGRVDVLINNAGIMQVSSFQAATRELFEESLNVMLWGTINMVEAVLPLMRRQHFGRIVNVSSIGGMLAVPHLLPYTAAKFAVFGYSEGLHAELAADGIAVTTVAPGVMRSGSYINAEFSGDSEYRWFALSSSVPFFTVPADRAARRIIKAMRFGEPLLIIGAPANIAARLHGLFPGTAMRLMSVVNRLMPHTVKGRISTGFELEQRIHSPAFVAATKLGLSAAEETLQLLPHHIRAEDLH